MGWNIEILEDPHEDYRFPEGMTFDYEIEKPIPLDYGLGVIFTVDGKGKYKTVDRSFPKRIVMFKISTWIGCGDENAKHFYGKFTVYSPSVEVIVQKNSYEKVGEIFGTNVMPEKYGHKFIEFELTRIAEIDEYGYSLMTGERRLETKKGRHTHGFKRLSELRSKMEGEFKRIFNDGWILKDSSGSHEVETEYQLFEDYGAIGMGI